MELFSKDPYVLALGGVIGLAIVLLSIRQFNVLAIAHSISDFPKDARSWTTFYNFFFSAVLYVSFAIGLYVIFIGIPELATLIVSSLSAEPPERLKEILKQVLDHKAAEWARPVVASVALIALFGFKKSPLSVLDRLLRGLLQTWASIPAKVTATVDQLKTAKFLLDPDREKAIRAHIRTKAPEFGGKRFDQMGNEPDFITELLQSASLDYLFERWGTPGSAFSNLYASNKDKMKELNEELTSVLKLVDSYLIARFDPNQTAEKRMEADKRSIDIKDKLQKLLGKQLILFACGILQSSRSADTRRDNLERFGYHVVDPPDYKQVFRALHDDLAMLVFFLILASRTERLRVIGGYACPDCDRADRKQDSYLSSAHAYYRGPDAFSSLFAHWTY
jgi:hypothetical protein